MKHRPIFSAPPPVKTGQDKPKSKWRVLPIIWVAFRRMLMVIGAMVMLSALISAITIGSAVKKTAPSLPNEMVLYLEFEDGLSETPPPANFSDPFSLPQPTVREIVNAIDHAASDDRVKGIMGRLRAGAFQPAHVQEIRAALKRFKQSGKFTKIYSSSYGGAGGGLGRYYLASAFDEIWMQPLGVVSIAGISAEMPFARGLLDKIGVTPQFLKRKDYKTAYESLTDSKMSEPNRESLNALLGEISGVITQEIQADRGFAPEVLKGLMDDGLFTSDQALEAKLIDRNDYADMMVEEIREDLTGDPKDESIEFIPAAAYIGAAGNKPMLGGKKSKVVLIYVSGPIMYASDGAGPGFGGSGIAAAEDIVPAIHDAIDDDDIDTIVLRVDSPGGSPAASESILHALDNARKEEKRVVVSMGSTAASGGYWVAAFADQIFVSETTITGSIGVVGGKFVLKELWEKLGVNWDGIQIGKNAGIWSMNSEFSDSEKARVDMMLDHIYDSFISRVAQGRNMSEAEVDAVAGGRVWSGQAAVRVGLADQLGGLDAALDYVARLQLGEEASSNDLDVVILPEPKSPLEQFVDLLGGQVMLLDWIRTQWQGFGIFANQPAMTYEPISVH